MKLTTQKEKKKEKLKIRRRRKMQIQMIVMKRLIRCVIQMLFVKNVQKITQKLRGSVIPLLYHVLKKITGRKILLFFNTFYEN